MIASELDALSCRGQIEAIQILNDFDPLELARMRDIHFLAGAEAIENGFGELAVETKIEHFLVGIVDAGRSHGKVLGVN